MQLALGEIVTLDSNVIVCLACAQACTRGNLPPLSIAAGVNFGRIPVNMPVLSLLETILIQRVRVFSHVLKLVEGAGQLAVAGHVVAVATTAAERAANSLRLPRRESLESCGLEVVFVGSLDRWQRLARIDHTGAPIILTLYRRHLQVRWQAIFQWLQFLRVHNPEYAGIEIDEGARDIVEALPAAMVANASVLADGRSLMVERVAVQNVPGAPTNDDAEDPESVVDGIAAGPLLPILVQPEHDGGQEDDPARDLLEGALQALQQLRPQVPQENTGLLPMQENDEDAVLQNATNNPALAIHHDANLVNEYEEMPSLIGGAFPCLFPLGYPTGWVGPQSPAQNAHLLAQADGRCSGSSELIMFLFNVNERVSASRGVSARWRTHPESIAQLQRFLDSPDFLLRLELAVANPSTPDAASLVRILAPLMIMAGRQVPFASVSSGLAISSMLAMHRFFGPWALFLTINPAPFSHAISYRIAAPILSNEDDLTGANFPYPPTPAARKAAIAASPFAAAWTFLHLQHAIINTLLSFPTPAAGETQKKTPLPAVHRLRGLLGPVSSFYMALETSVQGFLHAHSEIYSPLTWYILQQIAHNPELNATFGRYLDSIICTSIPYEGAFLR